MWSVCVCVWIHTKGHHRLFNDRHNENTTEKDLEMADNEDKWKQWKKRKMVQKWSETI